MKQRTYKLKDLSYAGLSMSYIGLMIVVFVGCIVLAAMSTMNNNWLMVIFWMGLCLGINISLYRIGTKYGDYGLIILIAKLFQPKHIRNDFPLLERRLLQEEKDSSTTK